MANNTYNIPVVTAGSALTQLAELYTAAFEGGVLSAIPSVALWGKYGVGKSTLVRELAEELEFRLHKRVTVTDIRLINFSPVDLRGIPSPDEKREFSVWLKPKILDLDENAVNIVFFDELSSAPTSLQAVAYQIALDKRIGEHKLPDNCIVICAGNRTTDRSVAFQVPKALANRLLHFEITADFRSWHDWALTNGIDERVIGYLSFDHSKLDQEAGVNELAFPTPRSWEFVSRLLKTTGKTPEAIHDLLCGCIGVTTAGEFEAWCRVYRYLPATGDILSGRCTTQVKKADQLYALISSLQRCLTERREELTDRELENICRYVSGFPVDFASMFFHNAMKIEGMSLKLMKIGIFADWMKRNKSVL